MSTGETVLELISPRRSEVAGDPSAGRAPLTFGALARWSNKLSPSLNGFGVGRGDRVAIVLPNGPEMATAFLAVAAGGGRGAAQSDLSRRRNSNST